MLGHRVLGDIVGELCPSAFTVYLLGILTKLLCRLCILLCMMCRCFCVCLFCDVTVCRSVAEVYQFHSVVEVDISSVRSLFR